jgi:hypothetical protein
VQKIFLTLLISLVLLMEILIQPAYGAAYTLTALSGGLIPETGAEFHEGLCQVHNSNYKFGFINTEGKLTLPCKYSYDNHLGNFSEGLCSVSIDGKLCYLGKNGNIALKTHYPYATQDDFDFYYESSSLEEFKETKGAFINGLAVVRNDAGKCGFIDKSGEEVIPCQYDDVGSFEYGVSLVWNNKRYQVIDPSGKRLLRQEYESAVIEPGGIIKASNDTSYDPDTKSSGISLVEWYSYDVLDYSGTVLQSGVPSNAAGEVPWYKEGGYLTEVLSHDYKNWTTTYAVYDKSGKLLYTSSAFYIITSVHEGIGTVVLSGDSHNEETYIDIATGKQLLSEPVSSCYPFYDGYGTYIKNGVVCVMDKQGTVTELPSSQNLNSQVSERTIVLHDKSDYTHAALCKLPAVQNVVVPVTYTAITSSAKVLVNGKEIAFDAYTIGGSNYFKLRDLAYVLNGDKKGFNVTWNDAGKEIKLTSEQTYTMVGGEMAMGDRIGKSYTANMAKINLDGKEITLPAYNIGGNNYFKLRDVMKTFNISVGWDGATSTITVDTSQNYQE